MLGQVGQPVESLQTEKGKREEEKRKMTSIS